MIRGAFLDRAGESATASEPVFAAFVLASHNANTWNQVLNDMAIAGTVDLLNINITMPVGGGTLWILGTASANLDPLTDARIILVVDAGQIIGSATENNDAALTQRGSMAVNLAMALSAGAHNIKLRIIAAGATINAASAPTYEHAALYTELRP